MPEQRFTYKVRLKGSEEWSTISKENFNNLSLEDGSRMPEIQGSKVIITNYFNMFWGRVMGARNFRVFLVLSQFAYGNKDYSYPSLQTLADICAMSVNTVKAAVKELEELGFVIQILVYDNDKGENENNIYIIRKTTPFLSVEQFKSLPKKMQDIHHKYIQNIEQSERITLTNTPDYPSPSKSDRGTSKITKGGSNSDVPTSNEDIPNNSVDNVDNVDKKGQIGGSNSDVPQSNGDTRQNMTEGLSNNDGGVDQNLTPNKYNLSSTTKLNQLNNHLHQFKIDLFDHIKLRLSKPSFDTWISSLAIRGFDIQRGVLTIVAANQFQKDWIDTRYLNLIQLVLTENFELPGIEVNCTLAPERT